MINKSKAISSVAIGLGLVFASAFWLGENNSQISMKCGGGEGNYEEKCIDTYTGRPTEGVNGAKLKGGIGSVMNSTDSAE